MSRLQRHPAMIDFKDIMPFRSRFPWWGADLQTLRNTLHPPCIDLGPWPSQHLIFTASDGIDRLSGFLHKPKECLAKPLVIIVHGLAGSADSVMTCVSTRFFLENGYPVLRLNLRGAGDTASYCFKHYHSGLTSDIAATLEQLPHEDKAQGVVLFGFSLGGNKVLKFLSEKWEQEKVILAGITVCAPIEPGVAAEALENPRNRPYQNYLLRNLRQQALLRRLDKAMREEVMEANSIWDYDNRVTAIQHGFGDADTFYRTVASAPHLHCIMKPVLIIHAADDPWVPMDSYDRVDWLANPMLHFVRSERGGHCGFHGKGSQMPWYNHIAQLFLDRIGNVKLQSAIEK